MSTSSTTTISERFIIDFLRKQIIGTKASFDKASKGTGAIYEELATKVAKHPDFKLVVKEQKKHISKPKKVYDGLTFEFMEQYIAIKDDAERVMRVYEAVKNTSKSMKMGVYPTTKKWFLNKYKGFDMATAKAEITEVAMRKATERALSVNHENSVVAMPEKVGA